MRDSARAAIPSMKVVAMEQLRVVGLAIRREALLLCAGLATFGTIVAVAEDLQGQGVMLEPEVLGYLAVLVALVAPLAVWKGERLFGESEIWTMPVDHARHARLKIIAGWVWLMAMVSVGLLAIVSSVWLYGGALGVDETRVLVSDPVLARSGGGEITRVPWTSPLWQWALPFTASTAAYLAASAFLVGIRRPVAWGVGCWLAFLAFGLLSASGGIAWLTATVETVVYLFDLLASGGSESAQTLVLLDSGERVLGWTRLPTMGSWAAATAMWMALVGAAAWLATGRHREG
ncbi:MAG: hypothetical protein AB7T31_06410 [Gemmatimonadales bacterium]